MLRGYAGQREDSSLRPNNLAEGQITAKVIDLFVDGGILEIDCNNRTLKAKL
jgi:hypothetical protein